MTHPEQLEHYINHALQLEIDIAEREDELANVLAWLRERSTELRDYEQLTLARLQQRKEFTD